MGSENRQHIFGFSHMAKGFVGQLRHCVAGELEKKMKNWLFFVLWFEGKVEIIMRF